MGSFNVWHWLIALAVISLVFGTSKLRNIGSDRGFAIKGFKDGVKEGESLHDSIKIDELFGPFAQTKDVTRSVDEAR